jgi:hypothetical protein
MMKPKKMKWAGQVAHMRDKRNAQKVLAGNPVGKRPLETHRGRWEDNF